MTHAKEFRALPAAELRQRVADSKKELDVLWMKARQGGLEQPHQIRQLRRDVARMLTVLQEQEKTA